ncbi:MAG: HAD-IB family hydrolase [Deltaproteobacteria bacterium]|nr:HAD-IB family hydrolase [Deltaproteobacteria bacterium]
MTLHTRLTEEIRKGPSGPKVGALFDLDQTLLAGFSAAAFFRERLVSGRLAPREIAESLLGTLSFVLGRTGFSGMMSATTAAYRGLAESVMEDVGQEVFEKHLATQIYPESRALVRAHQEMGHTLAIISSATRYQADPFARDMAIRHVLCTKLDVVDGVFTGKVVRPTCYGEGKADAARGLAAQHDLDLEQSYFYTDSHEDLPLLEIVGRPRPLNPNRGLAQIAKERKWPVRRFTSRGTPSAGDVLRTALTYASLVPSIWAGTAAGLVNGSMREAINIAGSMWGDLATSLAGIDLRVDGEEHLWSHRPAVFIFNHQSALDTVLMIKLTRRDVTGVGKKEIRSNPIFGPIFGAAGVVFVDRGNTDKAIEALKPAVDALREGRSLVIAPEGTRSLTPRLGRFKKGAFRMAMQAGVPIVPVVFRNVLDAMPKDALIVRPTTIEAVVLPPIDTSEWTLECLDDEIEAIRARYAELLEPE